MTNLWHDIMQDLSGNLQITKYHDDVISYMDTHPIKEIERKVFQKVMMINECFDENGNKGKGK